MTIPQQMFLFFYAVLYGAFITLSDRWKPFTREDNLPGRTRYWVSLLLLAAAPVAYFAYVLLRLSTLSRPLVPTFGSFIVLCSTAVLVVPIYGFYCLWAGVILSNRRRFYADDVWESLVSKSHAAFMSENKVKESFVVGVLCTIVPLILLWFMTDNITWREVAIMEWSTIWTAVGSLATVLGVLGIGFALYQLRFDAWLKAQEVFTSDEFVKARTAVFAHFDDPEHPWPDPHSENAKKVCRKMDEMAHLLPFIGRKKMLSGWSNPIAKAWLLLEPTVNEDRRTSHWDEKWKAFAELGAEAVRRNPQVKDLRRNVPPNTPLQPAAEKRGG